MYNCGCRIAQDITNRSKSCPPVFMCSKRMQKGDRNEWKIAIT
ncbi:hypothetical protein HMPREF3198_00753 [Winkia neuii]|nr:hypothetical protein HMPREF3198_00753 [Winkia neuii]